jgi:hypothetical protein
MASEFDKKVTDERELCRQNGENSSSGGMVIGSVAASSYV